MLCIITPRDRLPASSGDFSGRNTDPAFCASDRCARIPVRSCSSCKIRSRTTRVFAGSSLRWLRASCGAVTKLVTVSALDLGVVFWLITLAGHVTLLLAVATGHVRWVWWLVALPSQVTFLLAVTTQSGGLFHSAVIRAVTLTTTTTTSIRLLGWAFQGFVAWLLTIPAKLVAPFLLWFGAVSEEVAGLAATRAELCVGLRSCFRTLSRNVPSLFAPETAWHHAI